MYSLLLQTSVVPALPGLNTAPTLEGLSVQASESLNQATIGAWDKSWDLAMSGQMYGIMARMGLTIETYCLALCPKGFGSTRSPVKLCYLWCRA